MTSISTYHRCSERMMCEMLGFSMFLLTLPPFCSIKRVILPSVQPAHCGQRQRGVSCTDKRSPASRSRALACGVARGRRVD